MIRSAVGYFQPPYEARKVRNYQTPYQFRIEHTEIGVDSFTLSIAHIGIEDVNRNVYQLTCETTLGNRTITLRVGAPIVVLASQPPRPKVRVRVQGCETFTATIVAHQPEDNAFPPVASG